jgi:Homeobox KN domain
MSSSTNNSSSSKRVYGFDTGSNDKSGLFSDNSRSAFVRSTSATAMQLQQQEQQLVLLQQRGSAHHRNGLSGSSSSSSSSASISSSSSGTSTTSSSSSVAKRGAKLPKAAVDAMQQWLRNNWSNPAPSPLHKESFVSAYGISRKQVDQW